MPRSSCTPRRIAALCLCLLPLPWAAPSAAGIGVERAAVISTIDRDEIESSGLFRLDELLLSRASTNYLGTARPLAGGEGALYLIDGRPVFSIDLSTVPLASLERIEFLDSGTARHDGSAQGGTVNLVTRRDLDGTEASLAGGTPTKDGGEASQASLAWGGQAGKARILAGVSHVAHQEVRDSQRGFSSARFSPGGSFAGTHGVSQSGNTLLHTPPGADAPVSVAIGGCPSPPYAGVLSLGSTSSVCGYPYAEIKWQLTDLGDHVDRSLESAFLSGDAPVGQSWDVWWGLRLARHSTLFRYAPSAGQFDVTLTDGLIQRIALSTPGLGPEGLASGGEGTIRHRFLGHGNRDWRTRLSEQDVSLGVRGEVSEGIFLDAHVRRHRRTVRTTGGTFVSRPGVALAVEEGRYDFLDPRSTDAVHLAAVRETSLGFRRLNETETLTAQALLEGKALDLPQGPVGWLVGLEASRLEETDIHDYRSPDGTRVDAVDVIGVGDNDSAGERSRVSVFAELDVPIAPWWELSLSGRLSDHDDAGGTRAWALASRWPVVEGWSLRGSWSRGEAPQDLQLLRHKPAANFPVVCTVDGGERFCRQVRQLLRESPDLKPWRSERWSLGLSGAVGRVSVSTDWISASHSALPQRLPAQEVVDRIAAGQDVPGNSVTGSGNQIVLIESSPTQGARERIESLVLGAEASWGLPVGLLGIAASLQRTIKLEAEEFGIVREVDVPRDRGHVRTSWRAGPWALEWHIHGMSKTPDQNGSWTGHDLVASWDSPFGVEGLVARAGVLNLEDEEALSRGLTVFPAEGVRGRFLFAGASWAF